MKIKAFKFPLKYLLIALGAVIALAITLVSIFGFNKSVEFGGGYQVKINVTGETNVLAIKDKATKYLNKNGVCVESALVEDGVTETYLVVRSATHSIKNAEQLRQGLATELGAELTGISNFEKNSGSFNINKLIMLGIAVLVMTIVAFVGGLFRYKVMGGLILALDTIASFLTFMALMIITRLPLSSTSYIIGLISVLVSLVIVILTLEQTRANLGTKNFENSTEAEIVTVSANKHTPAILIMLALVALISIATLFVGNVFVMFSALSLLVAVVASVFIGFFTCSGLYIYLLEVYNINLERRVSKNPDKFVKTKKSNKK